jgi:hypothetical protein
VKIQFDGVLALNAEVFRELLGIPCLDVKKIRISTCTVQVGDIVDREWSSICIKTRKFSSYRRLV